MGKHLKEKLEIKAPVNKIIKFSSVDGPGNRCVIFFQGCNFNCKYCHNPETINLCNNCGECVKECPNQALFFKNGIVNWNEDKCIQCDRCLETCKKNSSPKVKIMSVKDILKEIEKVVEFIDGITVSGGECSLNFKFIENLFTEVKKKWEYISCFMDTNGSIKLWEKDKKNLLNVIDGVMLDIKNLDREEHKKLTGNSNLNVIKNFFYLKNKKKLYEVRTVVYDEEIFKTIDKIAQKVEKSDVLYKIIRYRNFGVREQYKKELKMVSKEEIEKVIEKYDIRKVIV